MKFKNLFILLSVLILASCSTTKPEKKVLVQVNDNALEWRQALAKCDFELEKMGKPRGFWSEAVFGIEDYNFTLCMRAEGYQQMKESEARQYLLNKEKNRRN